MWAAAVVAAMLQRERNRGHDKFCARIIATVLALCPCPVESKKGRIPSREVPGIIADNLSKASWDFGAASQPWIVPGE